MKIRILNIYVLFFALVLPVFAVMGERVEVCDECEQERLCLASDWRSFPVDMDIEDFDYQGPSKIHTMLSKAQEQIRNLKCVAQQEIEEVKESVEDHLKNIEQEALNKAEMIRQKADKEREASFQEAQKKSDDAKRNSFSTMIQIKYNVHQQALELMKEAEVEAVSTIYEAPDDKRRHTAGKASVVQQPEGMNDYLNRFNECVAYIEQVIAEGEPDESARNEMLALCEKQKKSFQESFEKNKGEMGEALLSRCALFERICQSHRAAVAPLDEQARNNILAQDHIKKMKLVLLYDIQQALAFPSNQSLHVPDRATTQPAPVTMSSLENNLISELNKRLALVEKHLEEQRKKTEEYATQLAHTKKMLHNVGKTDDDFATLQRNYLRDMELKEREKLEMHVTLKRLEDSLKQRQHDTKAIQKTEADERFAQERDHWGSMMESIKKEKLECEFKSALSLSELNTRVITLQNDLVAQQKKYEKDLQDVELRFAPQVRHNDQPSLAEHERIREKEIRADLAQAQLREQMFLSEKRY